MTQYYNMSELKFDNIDSSVDLAIAHYIKFSVTSF